MGILIPTHADTPKTPLQKMAASGRCRMSIGSPLSDFSIGDIRPARLTLSNAQKWLVRVSPQVRNVHCDRRLGP
jgi:hypothetical protein